MLKKVREVKEFGIKQVVPLVELGNHKEYLTKIISEAYPIDLIIIDATGKGRFRNLLLGRRPITWLIMRPVMW